MIKDFMVMNLDTIVMVGKILFSFKILSRYTAMGI